MQDCKGVKIPMPTNGHLCTDENGKDFNQKVYRSMIGSLLYLLYQIYDDDIIFGCTDQRYSDEFAYMMSDKMSMMGELKFFLGLQIRQ